MKKHLIFGVFPLISSLAFSQVGINTSTPDNSSILDITSQNRGVLFPRVSLQSLTDVTTIQSPAEGLVVWNTNNTLSEGKGLFYFLDGSWTKIQKQFSPSGKNYDFVEFKQTSSSINMTAALQEVTQLSTSYTAPANGNLFLNYIIYGTMSDNSNPRISNIFCEIQVTDTTNSNIQKGTILISPGETVSNQGSNAIATPSTIPIQVVKGHQYNIKIFAREAYLDTSVYTIRVGTVNYSGNFANSSLLINSLLDNS